MKTGILTFPDLESKQIFLNRSLHVPELEGFRSFPRECAPLSVVYAATNVEQGFVALSLAGIYGGDYISLESGKGKAY
jgi:hypothetical protein